MQMPAHYQCQCLPPALHAQPRTSTISALALSADGTKLYVGLSDGQLEEHRIVAARSGAYLSLTARKHISRKVGNGDC
jgi:hypothetical protein